ncbi:hypothetical protein TorRG33x02_165920 [Trema orientale]|uniref:Uncharacterized protein n=1 Tax=Trema orientale TaxID=63057 RepID=A0A2P5EQ08_TREOI|nr:hypothetical protein TorRG33x02_165920 [Trema orientale]
MNNGNTKLLSYIYSKPTKDPIRYDAIVDVSGVEEGDMDACQSKKLGELEHGVDMTLSCQGKDENSRNNLWTLMLHVD